MLKMLRSNKFYYKVKNNKNEEDISPFRGWPFMVDVWLFYLGKKVQ